MSNPTTFPGSRWWKFEFHCHTPASSDYRDPTVTHEEWLLTYMRAGFDTVVVSDHNSGVWIDPLRAALSALENRNHPEFRPLVIFPATEIAANGCGTHLLLVLDETKTTSDVTSLLGGCGYRGPHGAADGRSTISSEEILAEVSRNGNCILIPAHVDETNGIWSADSVSTCNFLARREVYAWERKTTNPLPPAIQALSKRIAEVAGSDAHRLAEIGRRWTWVKMSIPSLSGLRLALLDGSSSVRIGQAGETNPNDQHAADFVESISVADAKYIGRVDPKPFSLPFSPWMTSIIGGRGTGKSSFIEFARCAVGRCTREELPPELFQDLSERYGSDSSQNQKGLLLPNTEITVTFNKSGIKRRVRYQHSNKQRIVEECDAMGNWVQAAGTAENFPLRIYSQRQIFQLARVPASFLAEIDSSPDVRRREWNAEWEQAVHEFKAVSSALRAERSKLSDEQRLIGELDETTKWLDLREQAVNKTILSHYQSTKTQADYLNQWKQAISNATKEVTSLSFTLDVPTFEAARFPEATDAEIVDGAKTLEQEFVRIAGEIAKLSGEAVAASEAWEQLVQSSTWAKGAAQADVDYKQLLTQLGGTTGDATEYAKKLTQKQVLETKLAALNAVKTEVNRLASELNVRRQKLVSTRQLLTERRRAFLEATLIGMPDLKIEVVPFGDRASGIDEFAKLVRKPEIANYLWDFEDSDCLFGSLFPMGAPSTDFLAQLELVKVRIQKIQDEDVLAVANLDQRVVRWLRALTVDDIDSLETWFPEDTLLVKYRPRKGASMQNLENGSPGQQTAALLLFLISYGQEPILLDQPEDDLDNLMIYEVLTTQLAALKNKRQLIVVTHNANIVVNGDAEQVICLESEGGQTQASIGGLQEEKVRRLVCHVMEGGETAFELRYRRVRENLKP